MFLIKKVHAFKAGNVIDSDGNETNYTLDDLKSMQDSYDISIHEAPVVYGHESDKASARTLSSKSQLANGWVKKVYVQGKNLYLDLEVDEQTKDLIKSKKLKKRSCAFYPPDNRLNPTPGKWHLRHLALLGSEPPAVKGLNDIVIYSENNNMTKEEAKKLLNEKSAEWIAFILKDDGEGFGEDIAELIPAPAEENNWLFDDEAQQYNGGLKTADGKNFTFKISKTESGWESEVTPEGATEEPTEADTEVKENTEEMSATDEEVMENSEVESEEGVLTPEVEEVKENTEVESADEEVMEESVAEKSDVDALKEELARVREELAKIKEKEKEVKYAELTQYCEEVYESGRMVQSLFPKESLVAMLKALLDSSYAGNIPMYSEGDNQVNLFDGVKSLISSLPKIVEFSESMTSEKKDKVKEYSVPKSYGNVTEEDAKLYSEVKTYQEKHGCKSFAEARRAVLKQKYNKKY